MNADRGNLLEKGFYIEPRDFSFIIIMLSLIVATLIIELIIGIAIIIGVFSVDNVSWIMILLLIMDGAIILPSNGHIRYELKARKGDLDWDLHENGLLIKEWKQLGTQIPKDVSMNNISAPPPWKQLVVRFIRFDEISKVYFTEKATQTDECVRLFVRYHNEDHEPLGPRIEDEKSSLWGAARNWVRKSILFEGKDDRLLFKPVERKNIKDMQAFENIIRQKVKSVE